MKLCLCPLRSEADLTAICRWLGSLEHIYELSHFEMGALCSTRVPEG